MTAGTNLLDKCKRVSISRATQPWDGAVASVNLWWVVTDENEILFSRGFAPQCNASEQIAYAIRDKLYPGVRVMHLPVDYR